MQGGRNQNPTLLWACRECTTRYGVAPYSISNLHYGTQTISFVVVVSSTWGGIERIRKTNSLRYESLQ